MKDDRPKCSKCGYPMVDPKSIKLDVCLWCRPWLKGKMTDDG